MSELQEGRGVRMFSGNALKFLAAAAMLIDHIGLILFPRVIALRAIGRLAFPLFAYMIAEGCRYTRHKVRYLLLIFAEGAVCQAALFAYERSFRVRCNVLLTFSLSILLVYTLQFAKARVMEDNDKIARKVLPLCLFFAAVGGVAVLTLYVNAEYGFFGCLLPVFAALPHPVDGRTTGKWEKPWFTVPLFGVGLLLLCLTRGAIQYFSLFALLPLFFYSGKRGRWRTKYFFYIFYPAHLLLLQLIAWLIAS